MPTYPMGGPTYTVSAMLKQPRLIARRISDLSYERFISDLILARGTADQVAGGMARYQRAESKFLNRDPKTTGVRTEFPRAGWTEDLREAAVEQHGLEVPINGMTIRRSAMDQMQRAQIKLANSIVRFVDGLMVDAFLNDPDIEELPGSGWDVDGRAFVDVATALKLVREENEGYAADTMIIHEDQHLDLLTDEKLQAAMPRESVVNPQMTGRVAPFAGLSRIFVTADPKLQGKAIILQSGMVGTIADELPVAEEGYSTYVPQGVQNAAPISVMVYDEKPSSDKIIRGARWPAIWIAEPGAARVLTGI